jgi:hypothetical protein
MRKLKTILVVSLVIASLYATAGTAWARSDSIQRGTAWTDLRGSSLVGDPGGVSWELFGLRFKF